MGKFTDPPTLLLLICSVWGIGLGLPLIRRIPILSTIFPAEKTISTVLNIIGLVAGCVGFGISIPKLINKNKDPVTVSLFIYSAQIVKSASKDISEMKQLEPLFDVVILLAAGFGFYIAFKSLM